MSVHMESFLQFVLLLLLFVFVLAITYVTTRWIAKYQQGQAFNRNIQVMETYKLTANKYIQIVKIANKCMAIAITKDSITFLAEIEESELVSNELSNGDHFQDLLEKAKKLIRKK